MRTPARRPHTRRMPELGVNGTTLYYEEHGTGGAIVCIHGTGSSLELWRGAAAELAARGRAILYDRRGFSRSRTQRLARDTAQHTDDAAALIDALDAAPAIVIGRSHGAEIAVDLALRHPELVRALALLEGGGLALSDAFTAWHAELAGRVEAAAELDMSTVGETFLRGALGDAAWDASPEAVRQIFADNVPAIVAEVEAGVRQITGEELGSIRRPTLIVGATDSPPAFAEATSRLAAAMPSARVEWVDGGHLVNPAHPGVLRFVDEVLVSAAAPAHR